MIPGAQLPTSTKNERNRMRPPLFVLSLLLILSGCGPSSSGPAAPEVTAFRAADAAIISSSGGAAYGNNDESKALAKSFSESMKMMEAELFTGGKEDRAGSMTGDEFLTYCQLNEASVVFLVHVPQFKRYKGEVH